MVYFESRAQAGDILAEKLSSYHNTNTIVIALSRSSTLVARRIGDYLNCEVTLMLMEPIDVPGSTDIAIGVVNQRGDFVYNKQLGKGLRDELEMEFRNAFAGEKLEKFHKINRMLDHEGIVTPESVANKNVILVSDGLDTGTSIDAITEYLKPIHIERMIAAVPVATIEAVDRLHIACDELHVLGVIPGNFAPNHYYDESADIGDDQVDAALHPVAT
jgi:putative phosphoribosyl transferase